MHCFYYFIFQVVSLGLNCEPSLQFLLFLFLCVCVFWGSHSDPHSLQITYLPTPQAVTWKHFYRALRHVPLYLELNITESPCCHWVQNSSAWACFNKTSLKAGDSCVFRAHIYLERTRESIQGQLVEYFRLYLSQRLDASTLFFLPFFLFLLQHHPLALVDEGGGEGLDVIFDRKKYKN